jgi:hypothetical protein
MTHETTFTTTDTHTTNVNDKLKPIFIFQTLKHKKMNLTTNKVHILLSDAIVHKQKRVSHQVSIFEVQMGDFLKLREMVGKGKYVVVRSFSGVTVWFSYQYGNNEFSYFLSSEDSDRFEKMADEMGLKYSKKENE